MKKIFFLTVLFFSGLTHAQEIKNDSFNNELDVYINYIESLGYKKYIVNVGNYSSNDIEFNIFNHINKNEILGFIKYKGIIITFNKCFNTDYLNKFLSVSLESPDKLTNNQLKFNTVKKENSFNMITFGIESVFYQTIENKLYLKFTRISNFSKYIESRTRKPFKGIELQKFIEILDNYFQSENTNYCLTLNKNSTKNRFNIQLLSQEEKINSYLNFLKLNKTTIFLSNSIKHRLLNHYLDSKLYINNLQDFNFCNKNFEEYNEDSVEMLIYFKVKRKKIYVEGVSLLDFEKWVKLFDSVVN